MGVLELDLDSGSDVIRQAVRVRVSLVGEQCWDTHKSLGKESIFREQ